jgi:hypothetical protein
MGARLLSPPDWGQVCCRNAAKLTLMLFSLKMRLRKNWQRAWHADADAVAVAEELFSFIKVFLYCYSF